MKFNNWFLDLINPKVCDDTLEINNKSYKFSDGIIRSIENCHSQSQDQTKEVFGFKWHQKDTFNSDASLSRMRTWLYERYGDPKEVISNFKEKPIVLDAGCGAGMSGLEYWRPLLDKINYLGVDISNALDVAKERFTAEGVNDAIFLQDAIDKLPFSEPIFDVIFSEGVIHHTDSPENTFKHLCKQLKRNGIFMFYVYRKKGPIREYTDDLIREKVQNMPPQDAWEAMKPLTELGITLGKLNIEIDIPRNIELLDIPAGKIDLQRLFYWHVFKIFYDPKLTFDEMHHINFDWYAPKNAYRYSPDEIQKWCQTNNLTVLNENIQQAGITIVAKKN